ncbi:MAG: (2Fe-2S)-binding protein [Gemmatimonadales bacterium]
MTGVTITMCVCRQLPFTRLLPLARERGWTMQELMDQTEAGATCGLCRPYLRRMLRTGETVFHDILTGENEPPDASERT